MAKAKSILTSKICRGCSADKPLSEFHKLADGAGGVRGWCKNCATARDRGYRQKRVHGPVTEKSCARCKATLPADQFQRGEAGGLHSWCKPCIREYARLRRLAPEMLQRERETRWRAQGIDATWDDYQRMIIAQGGACAICRRREPDRTFAIDHDHATGKPRGVLCLQCNSGIGMLEDSPEFLRRALEYLES